MDFNSEDENSYSFTTARGETSEAVTNQPLLGTPDLNSTLAHQSLNSTPRDEVNERLKVLEQYCARPPPSHSMQKPWGTTLPEGSATL